MFGLGICLADSPVGSEGLTQQLSTAPPFQDLMPTPASTAAQEPCRPCPPHTASSFLLFSRVGPLTLLRLSEHALVLFMVRDLLALLWHSSRVSHPRSLCASSCPVPLVVVLFSDLLLVFARDPPSFPLIEIPSNPQNVRNMRFFSVLTLFVVVLLY